jgi:hypothetical protein
LQATTSTRSTPVYNAGPIIATVVGIPAAAIVIAALDDASLPIVGSGRGALIGLWILGSIMCGQGMASMRGRFGPRSFLVGASFGIAALALIVSALAGWSLLLAPIADAMRGSGPAVSLDRAAIVGVGAIMVVKWTVAWASYLPRN